MRFLLRTLSFSYARQHLVKTLLTLAGVAVGVATFAAIQSARTALVDGLQSTVDRIGGKAHLQISADGGVPEGMREALYELAGVRADAPVIEQVVVPEDGALGSLLVLGVDLLGDREMREYGFAGQDVDLDDPLLFLAQADSIALSRSFAERAGIGAGDTFSFRTGMGLRQVVVRGLLEPRGFVEGFGGNVAVMDVYAAQGIFGRGRRFDRIDVRLAEGLGIEDGSELLEQAIGKGYRIDTPARRGAQMERLISSFTVGFSISSAFALGIGTFLIYNAFSVAVNRRRRDIGTLRALGATPRQVQALFLFEAAWIGVVGSVLGLGLGAVLAQVSLQVMGETVETIYGLVGQGGADIDAVVVVMSLFLGILASLAGAWQPARAAALIHPTQALAQGVHSVRLPVASRGRLALGWGALLGAILSARFDLLPGPQLVAAVIVLSTTGAVLLIGPVSRRFIALLAPLIGRVSAVSGRLAVDSLVSNPRRTAGTVIAMTLVLAFVLGVGGYIHSTRDAIVNWMDAILTSDIYVRASVSLMRRDFRFPPELREELLEVPGVRAVESFRMARVPYRGDEVAILSIQMEPTMARSHYQFLQGDEESMRRGVISGRECVISDNFHRRFRVGVGDRVELVTPAGAVSIPIAAVVVEFTSDKGTLYIDRSHFLELFGDDRVDTFDVSLEPGVDPTAVRAAIRSQLGGRMPALVSTRQEFVGEIGQAVDGFYALMQVTVMLALVVGFLGIVSSLLISVAERSRDIGILKALGARGGQIRRSVVCEALLVALVALVLAVPLGALVARFLETTVAEAFAGWRMPHRQSMTTLLQLLVALPVVATVAAWLPARAAARTPVVEAIVYE